MCVCVCLCVCVCVFGVRERESVKIIFAGTKREISKYFRMKKSSKRFISFEELIISFLHSDMLPAFCFPQSTFNGFSGFYTSS